MESKDWAQYIEATDGLSKPWLLIQWRLKLLQDQRGTLDSKAYLAELAELHQALMNLGEWWQGLARLCLVLKIRQGRVIEWPP